MYFPCVDPYCIFCFGPILYCISEPTGTKNPCLFSLPLHHNPINIHTPIKKCICVYRGLDFRFRDCCHWIRQEHKCIFVVFMRPELRYGTGSGRNRFEYSLKCARELPRECHGSLWCPRGPRGWRLRLERNSPTRFAMQHQHLNKPGGAEKTLCGQCVSDW